ncbi:MAG: SpoIIE family protein phosphatase [Verrucomicrobiota bacterium]|nr:SpoIIE family protein phosphatase [Verrucomicrobiota bacterium]
MTPEQAVALHAGDSRLYRYRKGGLAQMTRDHSLAEEAGFKNRKGLPRVFRGMVTRGVGIRENLALEETAVEARESDLFILCSDGLTGMVSDKRLRKLLRMNEEASLKELARTLVAEANESGGDDNISVILVRVGPLKPVAAETIS